MDFKQDIRQEYYQKLPRSHFGYNFLVSRKKFLVAIATPVKDRRP